MERWTFTGLCEFASMDFRMNEESKCNEESQEVHQQTKEGREVGEVGGDVRRKRGERKQDNNITNEVKQIFHRAHKGLKVKLKCNSNEEEGSHYGQK